MASGWCGGAGARPVEWGAEARPPHRIQGFIGALHAVGPPPPRTQRLLRRDARWTPEGLPATGKERGRQGDGLASRDSRRQEGWSPARGLEGPPAAARLALDPQPRGHVLTAVGWPTGQQGAHLPARLCGPIMFVSARLPARIDIFTNAGGDSVHGLPSKPPS